MYSQPFNFGRSLMRHLLRSTLPLVFALCATVGFAQDKPSEYKLGPGDSIRIQVYQNPDLTTEARVSETGGISYPMVGGVQVGGLSISQAESRIAQALRNGNILKSPQVNIVLHQVRGNQV